MIGSVIQLTLPIWKEIVWVEQIMQKSRFEKNYEVIISKNPRYNRLSHILGTETYKEKYGSRRDDSWFYP